MDRATTGFTAVFVKGEHGYIGFVEELPGVTSHGRTLDEARAILAQVAQVAFVEERRESARMLAGREVVREPFLVPIARD